VNWSAGHKLIQFNKGNPPCQVFKLYHITCGLSAENNGGIQAFIASFVIALTSIFIYLITKIYLKRIGSLLIVFIFAFCTSAWSTASGALWQHGPSMLMLAVALYFILLAQNNPRLVQFVSLPLAFSFVIRPTNLLSVAFLTIFILVKFRKFVVQYALWSGTILVPFLLYNFSIYHKPLSNYYLSGAGGGVNFSSWQFFAEGPLALLISPSRGLFIFTLIFLFFIWGLLIKLQTRTLNLLDYLLVTIMILHWLLVSSAGSWWGGHTYGPRYLFDIIPYLIYFLIPVLEKLNLLNASKKTIVVTIFSSLLIVSFLIQFRGATSWEAYETWNKTPVPIDYKPSRVWDWSDIQFLRGL